MKEWITNGVRLAWLIDPMESQVFIYREDGTQEHIANLDDMLSGEIVLPGFKLDLSLLRLP
jgi:Uma2 family endonuclease